MIFREQRLSREGHKLLTNVEGWLGNDGACAPEFAHS